MGLGNILLPTCRRHSPSDSHPDTTTIPTLTTRHRFQAPTTHQQGLGNCMCSPVVDHPSIRSISSEPRTQQPLLCRSPCSQLASSPYDTHRRRPCSQLARDRTTAHPAPTLRKPLLPTSKPAAHKLFQHPQVMYHPPFLCTQHKPNACSWRVWWRPHEEAS